MAGTITLFCSTAIFGILYTVLLTTSQKGYCTDEKGAEKRELN